MEPTPRKYTGDLRPVQLRRIECSASIEELAGRLISRPLGGHTIDLLGEDPMKPMGPADIEIQPIHPDHEGPLYEAAIESIDDTFPWMDWCHPGRTREETASDIAETIAQQEKRESYVFSVLRTLDRAYLGLTGLNRIHWQDLYANLWYWIRTSQTGQGLAAIAAHKTAAYGFQILGFQRIEIVIACGNPRSRRGAIKLGATEEGIARNRCRHHGSQSDGFMFSLIPSDLGGLVAA